MQALYLVHANTSGFERLGISFQKNTDGSYTAGTLSFHIKGQDYSFLFGFNQLCSGRFPLYDMNYAASGLWVNATTLYIKAHIIDCYLGSVHFELSFDKQSVTVFMKKQEESLFNEFNGHLYCTI